ncbi:MAG: hypothetical protein ACLVJ6_02955 [Merdibacter sp.]
MKRSWYAAPYAVWMALFTVVPLLFVCYYAFTTRTGEFTTENLTRIFDYAPVLFDSLRLALYCTALCLLIGYPAAYFMASRDMSQQEYGRADPAADVDELPLHLRDDDAV